jgi:hypothetical protein
MKRFAGFYMNLIIALQGNKNKGVSSSNCSKHFPPRHTGAFSWCHFLIHSVITTTLPGNEPGAGIAAFPAFAPENDQG